MTNDEFSNLSVCIRIISGFNILVESTDIKDKRNLTAKNDRQCIYIYNYIFLRTRRESWPASISCKKVISFSPGDFQDKLAYQATGSELRCHRTVE